MKRPEPGDYKPYYDRYLQLTRGADFLQNLEDSADQLIHYAENLPPEKYDLAYAEGKWSIRQMLQHIIDTDQVFTDRALWMLRQPGCQLPGYPHDEWAQESLTSLPDFKQLLAQFRLQRQYMLNFFHNLSSSELEKSGTVDGHKMTVRAIPFIMSGHVFHHLSILSDRYYPGHNQ